MEGGGQNQNTFCYCSSKGQTLSNHRILWPSHYGTVRHRKKTTGIISKCAHVPQHCKKDLWETSVRIKNMNKYANNDLDVLSKAM